MEAARTGKPFAGPVSYTHLDVYKRQVEGSKFWFNCNPEHPRHWFYEEWIQKRDEKNAYYLHFRMEDNPSLSEKMIAVSYTHLDVYKRQGEYCEFEFWLPKQPEEQPPLLKE